MPAREVEKNFKESLGDIQRFDDGKYLYRFFTGKFDVDKFNRDFDQYKQQRKVDQKESEEDILNELNKKPNEPPPYELPIGQICINVKDSVFGIIDDLLVLKMDDMFKNNRLFYLGIFIIFSVIVFYMYIMFTEEPIMKKDPVFRIKIEKD